MEAIRAFNPSGIIFSGGPESAFIEEAPKAHDEIFELGTPILGICYGMQTMAEQLGGKVEPSSYREFGYAKITMDSLVGIFDGLDEPANELDVWMSHGDRVEVLPPGFDSIASTDNAPLAAMGDLERSFFGLQFHPEVTHTEKGQLIIENFVYKICGCNSHWNPGNIIEADIKRIRDEVGDDNVLLGLSGGVDSSVVAALLHQAIGDQLTCIFVDNGLLRLGEADSMTSGYIVPWASHLTFSILLASCSKTSMNVLPIIVRFFSGSLTPSNLPRNKSSASTRTTFTFK